MEGSFGQPVVGQRMESLTPRRVVPPHSLKLERSLSKKKRTTTQRIYHNSVIRAATRIYNPLQNDDILPLLTTTRGGKQQTMDNNYSSSDPLKELNSIRQSKAMKKLTIMKGGITPNQELLQMQKERAEFNLSNDPDTSREIKNPITGGGQKSLTSLNRYNKAKSIILKRPELTLPQASSSRNTTTISQNTYTLDERERYQFEQENRAQRMIPLLQIRHLISNKARPPKEDEDSQYQKSQQKPSMRENVSPSAERYKSMM